MKKSYHLGIHTHFDGAHFIKGHKGRCASLHGHRWDIEVVIKGSEVDELGMLVDFAEIKRVVHALVNTFDHSLINEKEPFTDMNPTAENLAAHLYRKLKPSIPGNASLAEVKVWEAPGMWASYCED